MLSASRAFRLGVVAATILFPWPARRLLYRGLFQWTFETGASIGLSLVDARRLHLRRGARIGHFNVIRQMSIVELGEGSTIGQWNWITSAPELAVGGGGYLSVGHDSAITSRHYIDCSGGVKIGSYTTIAGVRTVVLSHQIDVTQNVQTTAPVEVGDYVLVSSNVCMTPGSRVPASCVIAMGAVVVGSLAAEGALYAGVPAKLKRRGIGGGAYFARTDGVVRSRGRLEAPIAPRIETETDLEAPVQRPPERVDGPNEVG